MSFKFTARSTPFPRWMGPFSPARGVQSGFRFHRGVLGTWVRRDGVAEFWTVSRSAGVRALEELVASHWGAGRVLLLPNGCVVKPLRDLEVGKRVVIGGWSGAVVLQSSNGDFNMAMPPIQNPGASWDGPDTTGLECTLDATDGSLSCSWYHPSRHGRDEVRHQVRGADAVLRRGYRACRANVGGGRVRVTANGHLIMKRQNRGSWQAYYVGHVDRDSFSGWSQWIGGNE